MFTQLWASVKQQKFLTFVWSSSVGPILVSEAWGCGHDASTTHPLNLCPESEEAVKVLDCCLDAVVGWMRASKLKMNPDRMEALWMGDSLVWELEKLPALGRVALSLKKQVYSVQHWHKLLGVEGEAVLAPHNIQRTLCDIALPPPILWRSWRLWCGGAPRSITVNEAQVAFKRGVPFSTSGWYSIYCRDNQTAVTLTSVLSRLDYCIAMHSTWYCIWGWLDSFS